MREFILCLLVATLLQAASVNAIPKSAESAANTAPQAEATPPGPALGAHIGTEMVLDVLAILFGAALIALSYFLGRDDQSYFRNWLVCLLGATLGFGAGILISPYKGEEQQFSSLLQAGSVFVSGYLLSKLDPLIERYLKRDNLPDVRTMQRIALFATSFALATVVVFVNRQYDSGTLSRLINAEIAKKQERHSHTATP